MSASLFVRQKIMLCPISRISYRSCFVFAAKARQRRGKAQRVMYRARVVHGARQHPIIYRIAVYPYDSLCHPSQRDKKITAIIISKTINNVIEDLSQPGPLLSTCIMQQCMLLRESQWILPVHKTKQFNTKQRTIVPRAPYCTRHVLATNTPKYNHNMSHNIAKRCGNQKEIYL